MTWMRSLWCRVYISSLWRGVRLVRLWMFIVVYTPGPFTRDQEVDVNNARIPYSVPTAYITLLTYFIELIAQAAPKDKTKTITDRTGTDINGFKP